MQRYILFADRTSEWFGRAFAWLILVMTFGTSFEVFVRYFLRDPTSWSFDVSYITYGTLFMMGGAYALARNGHVRGDFIYRLWSPRTQARVELVLYFLFFFPGILALIFIGWKYASRSWAQGEVSINSPAGVPVYGFKMVIAAASLLLFIQGIAEVMRCIICIRTGAWPARDADVEELDVALIREVQSGHIPVVAPGQDPKPEERP
ncbi:MAG: TRAP transporter small permease subunit [Cucumibacter sp.]